MESTPISFWHSSKISTFSISISLNAISNMKPSVYFNEFCFKRFFFYQTFLNLWGSFCLCFVFVVTSSFYNYYFFLFITDYELMTFGISLDLSGVKMKMKNWSASTAEKLNYPVEDRSVFEIHWIYVWSENDTELHKSFLGCFESFLAKFTGQT